MAQGLANDFIGTMLAAQFAAGAAEMHAEPPRRAGMLFDKEDFTREFADECDRELAERVEQDRRRRARNQAKFKGEHAQRRAPVDILKSPDVDMPVFMLDDETIARMDDAVSLRMAEVRLRWDDAEYERRAKMIPGDRSVEDSVPWIVPNCELGD